MIAAIGLCLVRCLAVDRTERPEQSQSISAAEKAEIAADQEGPRTGPPIPLGALLTRPAVLATAFAFFGYAYILYFFLSWFPTYLTIARHLSLQSMSFVSTIPWLLGFVGLAAGGAVSDAIFRLTGNAVRARKLVLVFGLLIAAVCVALAGSVATVQAAVALMAISAFFMYLTGNTYWAIILDTVEKGRIGGVGGFVHLIANTAGIVAPSVTGFMVEATGGSYAGAFVWPAASPCWVPCRWRYSSGLRQARAPCERRPTKPERHRQVGIPNSCHVLALPPARWHSIRVSWPCLARPPTSLPMRITSRLWQRASSQAPCSCYSGSATLSRQRLLGPPSDRPAARCQAGC